MNINRLCNFNKGKVMIFSYFCCFLYLYFFLDLLRFSGRGSLDVENSVLKHVDGKKKHIYLIQDNDDGFM